MANAKQERLPCYNLKRQATYPEIQIFIGSRRAQNSPLTITNSNRTSTLPGHISGRSSQKPQKDGQAIIRTPPQKAICGAGAYNVALFYLSSQ